MKATLKIEAQNISQILTALKDLETRIKEGATKGEWTDTITLTLEVIEL